MKTEEIRKKKKTGRVKKEKEENEKREKSKRKKKLDGPCFEKGRTTVKRLWTSKIGQKFIYQSIPHKHHITWKKKEC